MSDVTILPAPDLSHGETSDTAWEGERRAFLGLLPTLLATHRGQYVAVHKGCIIAEGPDQVEVAKQAYARVGYVPIHVGLVTDEPPRPVRIPSPRLLPGRGLWTLPAFLVELRIRELDPVTVKVLASHDEPYVLLGRDMLNRFAILLNGPNLVLEVR